MAKSINVFVENYPTKYKEGFTQLEIEGLLQMFIINRERFDKSMLGHTYMKVNGEPVYYHIDIINALKNSIDENL
jgi:hypothetical protein